MFSKIARLFLAVALCLGALSLTRVTTVRAAAVDLSNNLGEAFYSTAAVDDIHWHAQSFNTDATHTLITQVEVPFCVAETGNNPTGTFEVQIWTASGTGGTPGAIVTDVTTNRSVTGLLCPPSGSSPAVVFSGLAISLSASTQYYLVVSGVGLGPTTGGYWDYTQSESGIGFPSDYYGSSDAGANWGSFSDVDPRQMRVVANTPPCVSTGSTSWDLAGTWTCGHVPDGTEAVTIAAGHTVFLSSDVLEHGPLTLNGDIDTGSYVMSFSFIATLSGAGEIVGTVRRADIGPGVPLFFNNTGTILNFNFIPFQIDVKLTRSAHPDANAAGGGNLMLDRYYTITPLPASGIDAIVCLGYKDSELGTISEANLRLCRWDENIPGWICSERDAISSTATNQVCAAGVTQFSDWVVGAVSATAIHLERIEARSANPGGLVLVLLIPVVGLVAWRKKR
jgi:hypothetical protein